MTARDWDDYRYLLHECIRNETAWMMGSADKEQELVHEGNIKGLNEELRAIDENDFEKVFEMNECETEEEFEKKYGYA